MLSEKIQNVFRKNDLQTATTVSQSGALLHFGDIEMTVMLITSNICYYNLQQELR